MPTVQSRLDSHRRDAAKAVKILQKARTDAFKDRGYQSAPTRAELRNEFLKRNNGMVVHEWQIDMGEALLLGLDCSLIAGTGAGKTIYALRDAVIRGIRQNYHHNLSIECVGGGPGARLPSAKVDFELT
jgi:hypothetical protein